MNSKYLIHIFILLLIGGNAFCKTIKVPEDKPNLRAAIKKAKSGDVVLVSPGIYRGPDNKNLVIKKKGITVRSVEGPFNTVIDGEGTGRCFDVGPMKRVKHPVDDRTTIEGFTIRNFLVDSTEGGAAVRCQSYIWLRNCIIANNNAGAGGGIFLSGKESSILLYGNTIVENKGGGVYIDPTSVQPNEITLSIFWKNSPYELYSGKKELIAVCNIKDGGTSSGCFEDDPLFADPANGNYRLTSCSPCIDASDLSRKDRDGTATDVGAYSVPYAPCNPADLLRLYAGIDLQMGDSTEVLTDEDFDGELDSSVTPLRQSDIEASTTFGNTQDHGTTPSEEYYEKGKEYYDQDNFKEAYIWLFKAAEQGNTKAQYYLGRWYNEGKRVERDYGNAINWWDREQELKRDYVVAIKWWRKAAVLGNAMAQYELGKMYYQGKRVETDYVEAIRWWRKAAEQGGQEAQYGLAKMYFEGKCVETECAELIEWWLKAAEQGDQDVQHDLAKMYFESKAVGRGYPEVTEWWCKEAEQGNAVAQYNLGKAYYGGIRVKKDYAEGIKWYKKAAEQGNSNAQELLWLFHETDESTKQLKGKAFSRKKIAPNCLMIGMSYYEVMATMQVGKESYVIYDWPETATALACTAFDLAYQCSFPIQFDRFMCVFQPYKNNNRLIGMVFTAEYPNEQMALDNYKKLERHINVSQNVPYNGPWSSDCIASARWWCPSAPTTAILLTYKGNKYVLRFNYRNYLPHGTPTPTFLFP